MADSLLAVAAGTFTTVHIAATAAIAGGIALVLAVATLGRRNRVDTVAIGVIVALAVFLWRKSANMPQLNDDGLPPFSANDWLAPMATLMVLVLYGAVAQPRDLRRFARACAVAVVVAFAVNVITI